MRLLLVLAFLSTVVSAQSRFTYDDPSGSGAVNVTVTMSGGASYGVGLGFARFEIENTSSQAQLIGVVLKPHRSFEAHTTKFTCGPGGGINRSNKTAARHRHRPQTIALAQENRDKRRVQL